MKKSIIGLMVLVLLGCRPQDSKLEVSNLSKQKDQVVAGVASFAVSEQGLIAVQPFFDSTADLLAQLLSQDNPKDAVAKVYQAMPVGDLCNLIVLPRPVWEKMNQMCLTSYGYLCSEEMRLLPAIYKKLFELSPQDAQKQFVANSVCKNWL